MTRLLLAFLAAILLVLAGFAVGRSTAAAPRPAQAIPASAFRPVSVAGVPRRESDPERTGAPHLRVGSPAGTAGAPTPLPESVAPLPADSGLSLAKSYALRILGPRQYACLDAIVEHESRWNPLARNWESGAFGIPQALHGLTSTDPLTQVKWMLDYVARRYGTACAAWGHVEAVGWY